MENKNLVKSIVIKALEDREFALQLAHDPEETLIKYGFPVNKELVSMLKNSDSLEQLLSPTLLAY